jgi:mono/diheme cytochrome c family protein
MSSERPRDDQASEATTGREVETESPSSEERSVIGMHEPIAREAAEPRDGYDPIPTSLVFATAFLAGWAGWYLGTHSGGFQPDVFDPRASATAVDRGTPEEEPQVDLATLGPRVYGNVCQACHQQNGMGLGTSFPPLGGSRYVTGSPEILARIILHGIKGPIEVKGTTYNGQMPPWADQLNDREVAAVMTYVRSSFGNDASAVKPALVAEIRQDTAQRAAQWTAEELDSVERELPDEGVAGSKSEGPATAAGQGTSPDGGPLPNAGAGPGGHAAEGARSGGGPSQNAEPMPDGNASSATPGAGTEPGSGP